ncbi:Rho-binding antiterminator [Pseudomonas sp. B14-6]|uniref:Rho-binding antiterminator n=1 Tax=Pseudomonas sp. B14-6 TaxID=2738843 RepID=UPI00273F8409|nr:Rho-binding antiterminator [Pseudomonas sp. B14-6]
MLVLALARCGPTIRNCCTWAIFAKRSSASRDFKFYRWSLACSTRRKKVINMKYQPLDCSLYDFIEIVCMRNYELKVELLDGECLKARALTTKISTSKEEYLQLESPGRIQEVRLDMILAITILEENSGYLRKEFTNNSCTI